MKLILIYNANSGKVNSLLDSAHKVLSPKTYACALCDLTFGVFSEKEEWRLFREKTSVTMVFLHKDEFLQRYRSKWLPAYEFPVLLVEENTGLEVFMTTAVINNLQSTSDFIEAIESRLGDST